VGIAYRVDEPEGLSIGVWAGRVTVEEVAHHVATLAATPAWGAHGRILTDLSALDEDSRPTVEQISKLVELIRSELSGRTAALQWAVIANTAFDDATRFAEGLADDARRLIVFSTVLPACTWLGVDASRVLRVAAELRDEALKPR
jgi:hypothetical protein